MSKVIFVGNGHSGKNHEMGEVIDSYDIVVRFGWYNNSPEDEKCLGSKTTCWATAIFDPIRAKQDFDFIFQYSFGTTLRYDEVYKQIRERKGKEFPIYRNFDRLQHDIENFFNKILGHPPTTYIDPEKAKRWSSMSSLAWLFLHVGGEEGGGYAEYRKGDPDCLIPVVEKIDFYNVDWWDMNAPGYASVDGKAVGRQFNSVLEYRLFYCLWIDGKIRDLNPDSDYYKPPRV